MSRHVFHRATSIIALLVISALVASCGREAPVYQPGNIIVASNPAGAAIFLDDEDTGSVTPDTLTGLEPDVYRVSVQLAGFTASPQLQTAVVSPLQTTLLDTFLLSTTTLAVTSDPSGAAIFINGQDTGQTTPATLVGVPEGEVEVSLVLAGFLVSPASFTVDVIAGQANEVPADTFALRSRHTVLFEGFSNVNCQGCPQMATNMAELMHREGYGLDRVLYIKYSMNWPSASDPHYVYNQDENNARMNYYLNDLMQGIPVLNMEGTKLTGTSANSTPDADEIEPVLDPALLVDPGFLIDVTADFSPANIPVTVTLSALDQEVDLTGMTLFVALVQTLVEYDDPPGSEGETEFHYIFRDRADTVDPLGNLVPGTPQIISTTVLRDDWDLDTLLVIAFVQDDSDHTVYQAGSTALGTGTPARLFTGLDRHNLIITSGGDEQ